jgi:outer membrane protein TolC
MSRFIAPRAVRATADAVNAEIAADSAALVNRVKRFYLDALQSSAQSALEDSLVAITETELSLARAKEALGTGTIVDVRRAEITLGQQRVARLRAVSQTHAAQVLLFREIGVTQPPQTRLADSPQLPVQLPTLEQLLQLAKKSNPGLVALSYWETARDVDVVRARTAYAPVLDLSTGIGGYTYSYRDPSFLVSQARADLAGAHAACIANQEVRQALGLSGTLAECDRFLFSEAQAEALRRRNDRFPFSFSPTPRAFVAQISLPVFDRFVARQRIQTARVEQENGSYAIKAMTLDIEAKTTTAYDLVGTAAEIVSLENKNADQARIELTSAHERYAIGLETFLGLSTARSTYAQAEKDRIGAKYDYERAIVELENAVGHSIR